MTVSLSLPWERHVIKADCNGHSHQQRERKRKKRENHLTKHTLCKAVLCYVTAVVPGDWRTGHVALWARCSFLFPLIHPTVQITRINSVTFPVHPVVSALELLFEWPQLLPRSLRVQWYSLPLPAFLSLSLSLSFSLSLFLVSSFNSWIVSGLWTYRWIIQQSLFFPLSSWGPLVQ